MTKKQRGILVLFLYYFGTYFAVVSIGVWGNPDDNPLGFIQFALVVTSIIVTLFLVVVGIGTWIDNGG